MKRSLSKIFIFLAIATLTFSINIYQNSSAHSVITQNSDGKIGSARSRLLQIIPSDKKQIISIAQKIQTDINTVRTSKFMQKVSSNTTLNQILKQWGSTLRQLMTVTRYLQLYGIYYFSIYTFSAIPADFIQDIVGSQCKECFQMNYTQLGVYLSAVDVNNYFVVIAIKGGYGAQLKMYKESQIRDLVKRIELNREQNAINNTQKPSSQNLNNTPASTQSPSSQSTNNPPASTQSPSSQSPNNPPVSIQSPSSQSTNNPPASTQLPSSQSPNNPPASTQSPSSQSSNNPPASTQLPSSQSPNNPAASTQSPSSQSLNNPAVSTQSPSSQSPNNPPVSTKSPSSQNPNKTPASTQTQTPTEAPPQQSFYNAKNQTPNQQAPTQKSSNSYSNSSILAHSSSIPPNSYLTIPSTPPSFSLPLITQSILQNTTSFKNIFLSHNIPSNFVKLQTFSFKGNFLQMNTNGISINIIFSRVSDQKQMTFSQYLPPNKTDFSIPATLDLTGQFYLSVFSGFSGITSGNIYTVNPTFIKNVVSRSPSPIQSAALNLKGNDLWVEWTNSDQSPPCITKLIFSQGSALPITYLLSNYQTVLKVKYEHFAYFSEGEVNLQISQAFSNTQSAFDRTSAFSAPFNIIFNAVKHNFAEYNNKSGLNPVPLKVEKNESVVLSGLSTLQLQKQVILQTPNNEFLIYFIAPNASSTIVPISTAISIPINLNQSGVYILQINDAGGSAVYNSPIYCGDIFPLLPDFLDLSPGYLDKTGLQQPSLLSDRRQLVLNLVNKVRSSFGVNPIYEDANLSNLAQAYSQAQISGNFFGHIDPAGRSPSDRALAAGISEGVGQNLALNMNLTQAQLRLQRSPAHLKNMVNPLWTRVGLGVAQNKNNAYYLTQQFSSRDITKYPLTQQQLATIKNTVINYLEGKYPIIKSEDLPSSKLLSDYQSLTDRPDFLGYLRSKNVKGSIYAINLMVSYNGGNFMGLVKQQSNFTFNNKVYSKIGLTVAYKNGMLQFFGIFI